MPSIFGLSIVRFINMLMKVSHLYIILKSKFRRLLHSIIIRFKSLDLTNHHDVTATKRELLKLIHQQPATLYYELSGPNQFINQ